MKVKYIGEKSSPFTVITGKVYECIGTEGDGLAFRIIDETGEDYLYPVSQFVVVEKQHSKAGKKMSDTVKRVGFDKRIHPYLLQLRKCSFLDLHNKSSATINFKEGIITSYHTDDPEISTTIREYIVGDDELKELYSFFTMEALEKFEAMPEQEISQYQIGYYDWAFLRYLLISDGGCVSDGKRTWIYSNDPIIMSIKWMHKIVPFEQLGV